MELVYAARAIRRYWWVTALAVVLGVTGALLVVDRGSTYEAEAMVLVVPATESAFGGTSTDRYVQNQLVVLQSEQLAREVVAQVAGVDDLQEIRDNVTFEQLPGTDIVSVSVASDSPARSQAIANGYVESYLVVLQAQVRDARSPELDRIDQEIEESAALLEDVNERVRETMEPFIASAEGQAVPNIDQVDPGLATEREVVRDRYLDLLENRNALADELTAVQTSGQFVQEAALPDAGVGRSGLLLMAGAFAGLVLGGLGAVALARASSRVLDIDEVVDRLDRPVVATIPSSRAVRDGDWLLSGEVPTTLVPVINQLCVRAESSIEPSGSLTVVVAGAQSSSGATTVATAMATHLSRGGDVVLIDASVADPDLSRRAGPDARGVADFVEQSRRDPSAAPALTVTSTSVYGLAFAGLGDEVGLRLHRQEIARLIDAASSGAQIVVVDAGPLMSTASSAHLAEIADVVVLTVPVRQQRGAALDVVADQLDNVSGTILPVATPVKRSLVLPSGRDGDDSDSADGRESAPDTDQQESRGRTGSDPRVPVRPAR